VRLFGRIEIPPDEIVTEAARAGGPGGQNVNKVATKVVLRFRPGHSRVLGREERDLLLARLSGRLNSRGEIVVHASRFRERSRNLADARDRLRVLLERALHRDPPRRATRPTRSSRAKRLEHKRSRGLTKERRRGQGDEE